MKISDVDATLLLSVFSFLPKKGIRKKHKKHIAIVKICTLSN